MLLTIAETGSIGSCFTVFFHCVITGFTHFPMVRTERLVAFAMSDRSFVPVLLSNKRVALRGRNRPHFGTGHCNNKSPRCKSPCETKAARGRERSATVKTVTFILWSKILNVSGGDKLAYTNRVHKHCRRP